MLNEDMQAAMAAMVVVGVLGIFAKNRKKRKAHLSKIILANKIKK